MGDEPGRSGLSGHGVTLAAGTRIFALDPERLARFSREAQTLAALSHAPHGDVRTFRY
jgi:hypothetical protein